MKVKINFNLTSNAIENVNYQTIGIYTNQEKQILKFIETSKEVNLVEYDYDEIKITRKGENESILQLKKDFKTFYTVKTKVGILKIEIETKEIKVEENRLYVRYIIQDVGEVILEIKYEILNTCKNVKNIV